MAADSDVGQVGRTDIPPIARLYRFSQRGLGTLSRAYREYRRRTAPGSLPQPMTPIVPGGSGTTQFSM